MPEVLKPPHTLIEAYMGKHECDEPTAITKIEEDTSYDRLDTWCEWNGILGFTHLIEIVAIYNRKKEGWQP